MLVSSLMPVFLICPVFLRHRKGFWVTIKLVVPLLHIERDHRLLWGWKCCSNFLLRYLRFLCNGVESCEENRHSECSQSDCRLSCGRNKMLLLFP